MAVVLIVLTIGALTNLGILGIAISLLQRSPVVKITIAFGARNLYVGAYWDRENRVLYVCPIPTVRIRIEL